MKYDKWLPMADAPKDGTVILLSWGKFKATALWCEASQHESAGWCHPDDYYVIDEEPEAWLPMDALPIEIKGD